MARFQFDMNNGRVFIYCFHLRSTQLNIILSIIYGRFYVETIILGLYLEFMLVFYVETIICR